MTEVMADRTSIKVISSPSDENPFLVIYKPQGMASAPLNENDKCCALFLAAELFPQILNVKGKKEIEAGLVHRIDTVTDGLLLIASTQDAYNHFISEQEAGRFIKTYRANCTLIENLKDIKDGFPQAEYSEKVRNMKDGETISLHITSSFRSYGPGRKEVRPVVQTAGRAAIKKSGGKEYSTDIQITKNDSDYLCECRIENGFRHQVRNHLAWCSIPVKGDRLYNPESKEGDEFFFTATGLEFIHPVTGKLIKIEM